MMTDFSVLCATCGAQRGQHFSTYNGVMCPANPTVRFSMANTQGKTFVPVTPVMDGVDLKIDRCQHWWTKELSESGPLQCQEVAGHAGYHHGHGQREWRWLDTAGEYRDSSMEVVKPGPRKPAPILPVEVFHTKKFNEQEAWEAVVALSRGA